jgi:hypothetical protein
VPIRLVGGSALISRQGGELASVSRLVDPAGTPARSSSQASFAFLPPSTEVACFARSHLRAKLLSISGRLDQWSLDHAAFLGVALARPDFAKPHEHSCLEQPAVMPARQEFC